nr:MAG TPA: hypothetical protein [Bacteriophage sp.]
MSKFGNGIVETKSLHFAPKIKTLKHLSITSFYQVFVSSL